MPNYHSDANFTQRIGGPLPDLLHPIAERVRDLERAEQQLKEIRATLIVNFSAERHLCGVTCEPVEGESTHNYLVRILEEILATTIPKAALREVIKQRTMLGVDELRALLDG